MSAISVARRGKIAAARVVAPAGGVQLVGSIGKATSAAGTAHTASLGQAATANNLLIAIIGGSAGALRSPPAVPPTGWTELLSGRQLNGASAGMSWIYGKIAAGGETGMAITWTGNMTPGSRGLEFSGIDISSGIVSAIAATIAYVFSNNGSETIGDGTFVNGAVTAAHDGDVVLSTLAGRGTSPLAAHAFVSPLVEGDTAATGGIGVVQTALKTLAHAGDSITPDVSFTNAQGSPVMILGGLVIKAA